MSFIGGAPDSEAEHCDSIAVIRTPERDNPKFGSVTIELVRGLHGNTMRLTPSDAHLLLTELSLYLNGEGGAA